MLKCEDYVIVLHCTVYVCQGLSWISPYGQPGLPQPQPYSTRINDLIPVTNIYTIREMARATQNCPDWAQLRLCRVSWCQQWVRASSQTEITSDHIGSRERSCLAIWWGAWVWVGRGRVVRTDKWHMDRQQQVRELLPVRPCQLESNRCWNVWRNLTDCLKVVLTIICILRLQH